MRVIPAASTRYASWKRPVVQATSRTGYWPCAPVRKPSTSTLWSLKWQEHSVRRRARACHWPPAVSRITERAGEPPAPERMLTALVAQAGNLLPSGAAWFTDRCAASGISVGTGSPVLLSVRATGHGVQSPAEMPDLAVLVAQCEVKSAPRAIPNPGSYSKFICLRNPIEALFWYIDSAVPGVMAACRAVQQP